MRAREFLIEGGNVFDGTSDIDQKFAPNLTTAINKALTGTGINVITVGSAATPTPGKMSGDFDVMADETAVAEYFGAKDAKSARKALADYIRSKGFEVAQTGTNVHVKTPIGQQFAQVDIMVVPQAEKISKLHIHSLPKGSPYKGYNKQLAIHFLSKMKGYFWSAWQGLFARTPDGKKGEMISNDVDTIAKTLLGPQANAADLGSVESILKALPKDQADQLLATLKADPNWKEVAVKEMTESRGLFGRSTGDVFVDDNGNELRFQSIDMQPSSKPKDAFKSDKEMLAALKRLAPGADPLPVNNYNARAKAFGLATLKHPDGTEEKWVKWATEVPGNILGWWKNSEVPVGGPKWALKTKTAQKARSGLTPQDLIKTDKQSFSSVPAIVDRIAPGLPDPVREGIGMIANGKLPAVFVGQKDNLEAIRDHLGEIIQPIGLMSGVITGDADKAAQMILGAPYNKCKVVWPQAKNTNLIDSYFIGPNGNTLGVSSKGDKGANASVQNIDTFIKTAPPQMLKKHAKTIDIIQTIKNSSAKEGPVALGLKLGLINDKEAAEIMSYVNVPSKPAGRLSAKAKSLMQMMAADPNKLGYSVGYHMLAGLAKQVVATVNAMPEFSKACVDFLNQSAIIQIYTDAKAVGNDAQITGFRSVFPPNFQGKVLLTSGKVYFATAIKGKFTFDYDKK